MFLPDLAAETFGVRPARGTSERFGRERGGGGEKGRRSVRGDLGAWEIRTGCDGDGRGGPGARDLLTAGSIF